jgi:hypothetical protein
MDAVSIAAGLDVIALVVTELDRVGAFVVTTPGITGVGMATGAIGAVTETGWAGRGIGGAGKETGGLGSGIDGAGTATGGVDGTIPDAGTPGKPAPAA